MPAKRMILSYLLLALMIPVGAVAQCPDLIELDCGPGSAWFGLRHDGANIGQGHTVTLPCDGAILSAEFKFDITGNPIGGVPSLIAGDEIHVVVMDSDDIHIMSATTAVPADVYDDWLSFEFPEDMIVPAGVYTLAAYTEVERCCGFAFCYQQDVYLEGGRIVSYDGLDGPWFEFQDGHDAPFRVFIDSDSTPTEARNLGSVKDLFR